MLALLDRRVARRSVSQGPGALADLRAYLSDGTVPALESLGFTSTILDDPRDGGSLPNDVFADGLGLPTLWVPHSYPACAQHAPDEHLLGSVAREGLAIMAGLFCDLGELGPRRPAEASARLSPSRPP